LSRSVAFVTPRVGPGEAENDWVQAVIAVGTVALYIASGEAEEISARLIKAGKAVSTPVAVVENASLPNARIIFTTLSKLPNDITVLNLEGPALIILGEVYRQGAETIVEETVAQVRFAAQRHSKSSSNCAR
jgi:siroheme synthase